MCNIANLFEGLSDIGNSMSIGNLILGVNSVSVSYMIHYDTLLQNETDSITKCDCYFLTKCDNFITKCDICYKLRQYTRSLIFGPQ